jgi:hypothetical protein
MPQYCILYRGHDGKVYNIAEPIGDVTLFNTMDEAITFIQSDQLVIPPVAYQIVSLDEL